MLYFSSGKKQKKLLVLKIIISALIILFLVFSSTSCAVASKIIKAALAASSGSSSADNKASGEGGNSNEQTQSSGQAGIGENSEIEDSKEVSESTESMSPEASEGGNLRLVYMEITSDPNSNHFEHRVENIYSVAIDGSDKELIFSDINEEYDLGPIFNISPDGKEIGFLRAIYDENFEYITEYQVESVDIKSGNISVAASGGYLDLVGWITK